MKKNIQPLGNRVLIKRAEAKTTKGGILLPDNVKEKPRQGEIVAVGPGKTNEEGKVVPMTLTIGDTVLFSSYSGTEIKSDLADEDFLVLSEEDILAVLV